MLNLKEIEYGYYQKYLQLSISYKFNDFAISAVNKSQASSFG